VVAVAVAAHVDLAMAGGGLDVAHLDLGAGREALGVEPGQQAAVVLGEPHDLAGVALHEVGQRHQLAVLGLLLGGRDGPAVRAAFGEAEPLVQALDHVVGERAADAARVLARLGGRVAEEVGQEALDDPVAPDDVLGARGARGRQHELAAAALEQAVAGEALEHLADGRPRDAEQVGDARGDRHRGLRGAVLADRGDEEVDRLQVVVHRVPVRPAHPLTS
jgi:hypothetical protein